MKRVKLKLSAKSSMLLAFIVLLAVLGAVGTLLYTWQLRRAVSNLISKNVAEILAASDLDITLLKQRGFVAAYILDKGNDKWLKDLRNLDPSFRSMLQAFAQNTDSREEHEMLLDLEKSYSKYHALRNQVIDRYDRGDIVSAANLYLKDLDQVYVETARKSEALVEVNRNDIENVLNRNRQETQLLEAMLLGNIGVICLLGSALVLMLFRSVFRPLHQLAAEIRNTRTSPVPGETAPRQEQEDDLYVLTSYLRILMSGAELGSESEGPSSQSEHLAAIGQTVAQVAHEIKNRLVVIGGFARLIEKQSGSSERVREEAQVICAETAKMEHMLTQIKDFSKPFHLQQETISLNGFIRDVVSRIDEHDSPGIHIRISFSPDEPRVSIDKDRVEQVILNVIANAKEAMGHTGELTISTHKEKTRALVIIEDTGPGIPEDIRSRIFDPFFTTKKKGTGLGLSISRRIIAEHGGEIDLVSHPGKGTTFTLAFPGEDG